MSLNKILQSSNLGELFGASRVKETASRLRQMGAINKRTKEVSSKEVAVLLYALASSGKTSEVLRVTMQNDLVVSKGVTIVDRLAQMFDNQEELTKVLAIEFTGTPAAAICYRDGGIEKFGDFKISERTERVSFQALASLASDYLTYSTLSEDQTEPRYFESMEQAIAHYSK